MSRGTAVTGALLGLLLVSGCASPPPLALGVAADRAADVERFSQTIGAPVALYQWYVAWEGQPDFDRARADAAAARGAVPLLTWEPWEPGAGVDQRRYALARIADGEHDAYLARFARQVREWDGVLALRFAHELNAPIYPWSVGVNGNTAQDALAAWRHVRQVFAEQGAEVVWVWSVNVTAPGTVDYRPFFPGDDQVDWVGLDGYNGGAALPWGGWQSPEELLGEDLARLDDLTDRPLALTEVGSTEIGGDKAAWIRRLFELARDRRLQALVWFDYDKETDWRVVSSPSSIEAFQEAVDETDRISTLPPLPDRFTE